MEKPKRKRTKSKWRRLLYYDCPDCQKEIHISWEACPYCSGLFDDQKSVAESEA